VDFKSLPPLVGRDAVKAAVVGTYNQVDYVEAKAAPAMTTAFSNDLAFQSGTYLERYTMKGKKGETTDYGRYAGIAARGADGQWRFTYQMGFLDSTVTKK
jgi:hypothetical protein